MPTRTGGRDVRKKSGKYKKSQMKLPKTETTARETISPGTVL